MLHRWGAGGQVRGTGRGAKGQGCSGGGTGVQGRWHRGAGAVAQGRRGRQCHRGAGAVAQGRSSGGTGSPPPLPKPPPPLPPPTLLHFRGDIEGRHEAVHVQLPQAFLSPAQVLRIAWVVAGA